METIPYVGDEFMTTIAEIAKEAGLGTTTVSRYLNNKPYVSKEKREKIEAAIKKLDYTPNRVAKQLRTNKTNQIAVLVSRITNPFFAELFDEIERLLHKYGYNVMIMQTYDDSEVERHFLNMLQSHEVDAIMLASIERQSQILKMAKKFPGKVILVNESIPGLDDQAIKLDHYSAVQNGLNYLYKKGRIQIAYVTGGMFNGKDHGSVRTQAFLDFMQEHNLNINSDWLFENYHSATDGDRLAKNISELSIKPNAIFTNSDEVALGLIAGLEDRNIAVPEDIAVFGYDDQPFSKYAKVPLTTIRQPVKAIAEASVKKLLYNLHVSNEIEDGNLQLKVIIRQSA